MKLIQLKLLLDQEPIGLISFAFPNNLKSGMNWNGMNKEDSLTMQYFCLSKG